MVVVATPPQSPEFYRILLKLDLFMNFRAHCNTIVHSTRYLSTPFSANFGKLSPSLLRTSKLDQKPHKFYTESVKKFDSVRFLGSSIG